MKPVLVAYAVSALTILQINGPQTAQAGDSWNLLGSDAEQRSREASAQLFRSAASIFEGLAQLELRNFLKSRESFQLARRQLVDGAQKLELLAKEKDAAERSINFSSVSPDEAGRLISWYSSTTGSKPGGEMNAADFLRAASSAAARISSLLDKAYSDVSGDDPVVAGVVTKQISDLIYVGSIATRTYNKERTRAQ